MRTLALAIGVLLAAAAPAGAVGPVQSPQKCGLEWTAPTTNADGTALTDLAGYHVLVGTAAGVFPATPTATVPAAAAAPAPATLVKWDCRTVGLADGQKWATIRAFDTAGNESANAVVDPASGGTTANGIPFVFDATKPGSAGGLKVSP